MLPVAGPPTGPAFRYRQKSDVFPGIHVPAHANERDMMQNSSPEILVIIPARGGSKGIPHKNIVDLCGKPLIAYSIEAARKARLVTRVVVSTDSRAIAAIAESYGAEVPFLRPVELADDTSSLHDVIAHTLGHFKEQGYSPFAHVILLPTSPFRNPRLLNTAVEKLFAGYEQFLTAKCVCVYPWTYCVHEHGKPLRPVFDNTAALASGITAFKQYGLLHAICNSGNQPLGTYVHRLDAIRDLPYLVDIDTPEDLLMARELLESNMFDFELQ